MIKQSHELGERLDFRGTTAAPRAVPLDLVRAQSALALAPLRVFELDESILTAPPDEGVGLPPVLGHEIEPRAAFSHPSRNVE